MDVMMKKLRIVLTIILILAVLLLAAVCVSRMIRHRHFVVNGNVVSMIVETHFDNEWWEAHQPSDPDRIAVMFECIKKCELNNDYRDRREETAPNDYVITFVFDDGKTETRTYTAYPSTKYRNPFGDYYNLFDSE